MLIEILGLIGLILLGLLILLVIKLFFMFIPAAIVASTENIDLDVKWEGFTKGLFGQGLFMIRAKGEGKLFINTFGAIDKHVLDAGESLIVDNFHLVAFSDTCDYKVTKFGGLKETLL